MADLDRPGNVFNKTDFTKCDDEIISKQPPKTENIVQASNESQTSKRHFMKVLEEYSENSNFHGFRYIFAAATFTGRCLWSLLFLFACGVLVYQVTDRVRTYFARPVNVNIEVKHNDALPFPAVVFCNTNQFKMTGAESLDLYQAIRDFFTQTNKTAINTTYPQLEKLDMKQVVLDLGHVKEDFIFSCEWGSAECSPDNFSVILTDFGVCFSFNDVKERIRLNSNDKGMSHGLTVVVNLEQYEYMPGPNPAAGIRLLVYNPGEVPLVNDLGIYIPPASNALVGLQLNKVNGLRPPHGVCGETTLRFYDRYSPSACETECKTKQVTKLCSCRDFYMPWVANASDTPRYCTMPEMHTCMEKNKESTSPDCQCPSPCEHINYISSVSYSSISDFETTKVSANIATRRLDIVEKYHAARVSGERLDDDNVERDLARIMKMVDEAKMLNDTLQIDINGRTTGARIIRTLNTTEMLLSDYIQNNLTKDVNTLKATLKNRLNTYNQLMNYEAVRAGIFEITNVGRTDLSRLALYFKDCKDNLNRSTTTKDYKFNYDILKQLGDRTYFDARRQFDTVVDLVRQSKDIFELVNSGGWTGKWGNDTFDMPLPLMKSTSGAVLPKTLSFLKEIDKSYKDVLNFTGCAIQLYLKIPVPGPSNYTFGSTIWTQCSLCRNKGNEIVKYLLRVVKPLGDQYDSVIREPVRQLQEQITELNRQLSTATLAVKNMQAKKTTLDAILQSSTENLNSTVRVINHIHELSNLTARWKTLSKVDLADQFRQNAIALLSKTATSEMENFTSTLNYLVPRIETVLTAQGNLHTLISTRSIQHNMTWPNGKVIQSSTNMVPRHQRDLSQIKAAIEKSQVMKLYREFQEHVEEFRKSLDIGTQFFRDNFLRVTVFYRQLEYEEISQQDGYSWFALVCDVGGTAGLFLGASLLTVAELFYFVGTKFSDRKKVQPAPEKGDPTQNTEKVLHITSENDAC